MKTSIKPKALLSQMIGGKKVLSNDFLSPSKNDNSDSIYEVGVFSNYRDAKVALEELE